jgi:hypothetical protein
MSTGNRWVGGTCLLLLTAFTGCHPKPYVDLVAFDLKITNSKKKLTDVAGKMGDVMGQALTEQPGGMEKVRSEYNNCLTAFKQAQTDTAALAVPDDPTSKAYLAAYQKFLKSDEGLITNDYGRILKCLEDKKLSRSQKEAKIVPLVKNADKQEDAYFAEFRTAQNAFATAHHLPLIPTKD